MTSNGGGMLTREELENIELHYFGREGDQPANGMDVWTVRKLCAMAKRSLPAEGMPPEPSYSVMDTINGEEHEFIPRKDYDHLRAVAEGMAADAGRLDWLSVPGRWVEHQERDAFNSFHLARKSVHYYVNGRHTVKDGDTLREAIDAALARSQGAEGGK